MPALVTWEGTSCLAEQFHQRERVALLYIVKYWGISGLACASLSWLEAILATNKL